MSAPSWMIRLARKGRRIAPLPGGRGYGVYSGTDRRRRPLALLTPAELQAAISGGLVETAGQGGWELTDAGHARLKREETIRHESDGEGGFASQHRTLADRAVMQADGRIALARANIDASPLARYAVAREGRPALLERVHVTAGERLRADYDASAMRSRVTSHWSGMPRSASRTPVDATDAPIRALDARNRVMDALAAAGPGLDRLLVNMLIRETGMERAVRDLDWPDKAGQTALQLALERLAIHYGLKRAGVRADPYA
ncbi:MAG: DUF6456 domain-containing protein [Caulobacterales bacterium]|uniref:DUF6456 domain-containing protein n=1 Tax=Glycocaulis sp. TaxID=1969725 RepID=UPI003F9EC397